MCHGQFNMEYCRFHGNMNSLFIFCVRFFPLSSSSSPSFSLFYIKCFFFFLILKNSNWSILTYMNCLFVACWKKGNTRINRWNWDGTKKNYLPFLMESRVRLLSPVRPVVAFVVLFVPFIIFEANLKAFNQVAYAHTKEQYVVWFSFCCCFVEEPNPSIKPTEGTRNFSFHFTFCVDV